MGWWSDLTVGRAASWVVRELEPSRALPDVPRGVVEPGTSYAHLWLRTMRLSYGRRWTRTYHCSLSSYARTEHGGDSPAEFILTLSPDTLRGITKDDAMRVALGQTRLAGPVPYRGDGLEVELGLFAIPAEDLAAPYLDLLGAVGDVAGISFVGAALDVAGPIKKGLSDLVKIEDAALEIGVRRTFDPLRTGVFAVLAASRDDVGDRGLRLEGDVLYWDDGSEVTDIGYIVFSVETSRHRADWHRLPHIGDAYDALLDSVRENRSAEVAARLSAFKRAVLLSPDLVQDDIDAVIAKVDSTISAIGTPVDSPDRSFRRPAFGDLDLFPTAPDEPANRDA